MGFESFGVELRGGSATVATVREVVRRLPNTSLDPDAIRSEGASHFAFNDGAHLIELEVAGEPSRISCRFTLSHPTSVDAAFFELIRRLMSELAMMARVRDTTPADAREWFSLDSFGEFVAVAGESIRVRREEWQAAFGNSTFAGTTAAVHRHIILPRCESSATFH